MQKNKLQKQTQTANLCNYFLITHLLRAKQICERYPMDRKGMMYYAAISNIKKYPLPIVCEAQLKSISGIGDYLCGQLLSVIKRQYKHFANQYQNIGAHSQLYLNENNEKDTVFERNTNNNSCSISQFYRKARSYVSHSDTCILSGDIYLYKDTYSVRSVIIDKTYRPRPGTLPAYYLIAIKITQSADREKVKKYLKYIYGQVNFRSLPTIYNNLIKNGYLYVDVECGGIKLTEKGLCSIDQLYYKTNLKHSKIKVRNFVESFKSNHQQRVIYTYITQPIVVEKTKAVRVSTYYLCLVIDCREIKDKGDQSFFKSKLADKYNINCRTAALPIGDFLWLYNGYVMDYVIERKKADDLASSICDGRYKEQKYRLKSCGAENVYYLYEGHLSKNSDRSYKEINGALLKTKVKDGFKIVKTNDINESLRFIVFMHNSISKMLDLGTVCSIGTFEYFSERNNKSKQLTVGTIFGLSLKTLPGVGLSTVNYLLKYFPTFNALETELSHFPTRGYRIEFLRGIFKGVGMRSNIPELLVDFLFARDYN